MNVQKINYSISFGRKLLPSEEAEYSDVLKRGRDKVSGGEGKRVLIVPVSSLPQSAVVNTGVGNLGMQDSQKFFDFAKQYWGINEIQLLPTGQYHMHKGEAQIYNGTTMDLGNHMINPEDCLQIYPMNDLKGVVDSNKSSDKVNFSNVIDNKSKYEKALKKIYDNMPDALNNEFKSYKKTNKNRLSRKALYTALVIDNNAYDYRRWSDLDRDLFTEENIGTSEQQMRINELHRDYAKEIDFYKFKQFLADKSLSDAKKKLNEKGLKLSADMPCGFSLDEIWAHPDAFYDTDIYSVDKKLPALKLYSDEGKNLLRSKVKFYAERFDGFRVDSAWNYVEQNVYSDINRKTSHNNYNDKILKLIENETKNVKGDKYDSSCITYEFASGDTNFKVEKDKTLKPAVKDRIKIYTSDGISEHWGSNKAFLERGWDKKDFILGTVSQDSHSIKVKDEQVKVLSKILKISEDKLKSPSEFLKAKLAEPISAFHNMIFFMPALGIEGKFSGNKDKKMNYNVKIPENYEEKYFKALEEGKAFNPMDALDKCFVAQGLDKTDKKLYKQIVKYKKILESKEGAHAIESGTSRSLIMAGISIASLAVIGTAVYLIRGFQKSLEAKNQLHQTPKQNIQ